MLLVKVSESRDRIALPAGEIEVTTTLYVADLPAGLPPDVLCDLLGRRNSEPLDSTDGPLRPGTIILSSVKSAASGTVAEFLHRGRGWNRVANQAGRWVPVLDVAGRPLYTSDDEIVRTISGKEIRGFGLLTARP
jgi:hypothetical protein